MTPAQLTLIKAAIVAHPVWSTLPAHDDAAFEIASGLNSDTSPAVKVWHTAAPVDEIINAITWASYTPNDKVASTDTDPALSRKIGWLLETQVKQMNLQLMLQGRATLDASHSVLRAGLRDAVIQVPTGAGGAATAPGGSSGATVMAMCTRTATVAEDILAAPAATTGTVSAKVLTWEGLVTIADVQQARALP